MSTSTSTDPTVFSAQIDANASTEHVADRAYLYRSQQIMGLQAWSSRLWWFYFIAFFIYVFRDARAFLTKTPTNAAWGARVAWWLVVASFPFWANYLERMVARWVAYGWTMMLGEPAQGATP